MTLPAPPTPPALIDLPPVVCYKTPLILIRARSVSNQARVACIVDMAIVWGVYSWHVTWP